MGPLVLTSRTAIAIDGAESIYIYPQPLNSGTLLNFMTILLSTFLGGGEHLDITRAQPFSSIHEQLKLGERLAALIRLQTEEGEKDVPLVPLPVRLFVEQAVQLVQDGRQLGALPLSLPEVYFRHLRCVNPEDPSVPHFLDGDRMLRVAKALGKIAVGENFVPKEFSKNNAVAVLRTQGEVVDVFHDPVMRLIMNGVLVEKPGGIEDWLRFGLDPVAEFLAAAAYSEECGKDMAKWEKLLIETAHAPGFQAALQLTRQAYGKTKGWAIPSAI